MEKKILSAVLILLMLPALIAGCGVSQKQIDEFELNIDSLTFSSTDIDGNAVESAEVFAKADVNMINCWASWCGPCINELPELEAISQEYSDKGVQVIGLLMDGADDGAIEDAKESIEKAGTTYLNVVGWENINKEIKLIGTPTTFFVDSAGNVIGECVVGAYPESYREQLDKLTS